jgi:hypothetical protein
LLKCVIATLLLVSAGCDAEVRGTTGPEVGSICNAQVIQRVDFLTAMSAPLLVGDHLYVPSLRNSESKLAVFELGEGTMQLVALERSWEPLLGPPWQYVDGLVVRGTSKGLEVLDATDPLSPKVIRHELGYIPGAAKLGHVGRRVFFCAVEELDSTEVRLYAVDLTDPVHPSSPEQVPSTACGGSVTQEAAGDGWRVELLSIGGEQKIVGYALDQGAAPVFERSWSGGNDPAVLLEIWVDGPALAGRTWTEEDVYLFRLDTPLDPPARVESTPDTRDYFLAGERVHWFNGDEEVAHYADVGDPANVEYESLVLEPNYAVGGGSGMPLPPAYDGNRIVIVSHLVDVYVTSPGATGKLAPLTWVDEDGAPICPAVL